MKNIALVLLGVAVLAAVPASLDTRSGVSGHADTAGKGSVYVPRGLPDAVGQDSDHGDGEDVAESVRAPWFRRARSGASRRVGRSRDGALRTRWRPDGGYPKQASRRKNACRRFDRSLTRRSGSSSIRTCTAITPAPTPSSPGKAR